jgi:hypothetical protein
MKAPVAQHLLDDIHCTSFKPLELQQLGAAGGYEVTQALDPVPAQYERRASEVDLVLKFGQGNPGHQQIEEIPLRPESIWTLTAAELVGHRAASSRDAPLRTRDRLHVRIRWTTI